MKLAEKLNRMSRAPKLTRARIVCALTLAVVADGLQFLLLPLAWTFAESAVDVVAMILTMWLIGFHLLLLPTFAFEFIPVADALPTWTACVIAVIALRKRQERTVPPPPPAAGPTIEV